MMPPDWRQEYLSGIKDAEKQRPVDRQLIEAYSQLCDRVAILEAEKAVLQAQLENKSSSSLPPPKSASPKPPPQSPPSEPADPSSLSRLRLELAEALRARNTSQSRLEKAEEENVRLRAKSARDSKTIAALTAENRTATRKLSDLQFELRAKSQLVANVQDELAVLNMQLDIVEQKRAEKEAENKQLIDRFMRRIGQEAEAMNLANEPLFTKKTKK
ncbi:autophagy protein 16 [Cladorrhinum samala]|uniref:Autophagy protein 16 n=1 Tax=Cladorrhinum samala TaxID=585594 RepID=A0AAV9HJK6_9PEZI|nr:autophagy protein 16 [Cladorrhinum samala]